MKKQIGLLFFCSSSFAFSQQVTPQVVASSGDYFVGSSSTLSWTLGEIAIDTYNGTSSTLTQGFQQPQLSFSEIENYAPEISMSVFPNPTSAEINLEIKENSEILTLQILDASGKLIFTDSYSGNSIKKIDFSSYADGLYLLQVSSPENGLLKTFKIQKL